MERCLVTEIFYFSGTGNSLHIARELQRRIPETRLIPIVGMMEEEKVVPSSSVVGFVFPQYASVAPRIVEEFIQKMELDSVQYLFAVATRGRTDCRAFGEIDKILMKQGRRLDSFFVLTMPSGSSPILADPEEQVTEELIDLLESKAQIKLDRIQRIVNNREVNRDEDLRSETPPPSFLIPLMPVIELLIPILLPIGKMVESRFNFYTDEKCTGCRLCEEICLANRITLNSDRPVWNEKINCLGCLACFNYCPAQSIQIKSKWYLKSYTEKNGRYHHPSISAQDISEQKYTKNNNRL